MRIGTCHGGSLRKPLDCTKNSEFDGLDVSFLVDTYADISGHPNEKDTVPGVIAPGLSMLRGVNASRQYGRLPFAGARTGPALAVEADPRVRKLHAR